VTVSLKGLYSLKCGMEVKRGRVQSFASKHGRKELMRKYSRCEKNRVRDYVRKFVNELLEMYPFTLFVVEKLDKQGMFKGANESLSKKVSRTVWRAIHRVLKYKALLCCSLVKEVNPYLTSKSCPRCGRVSRRIGLTFTCGGCGFTLDRQLNASLNIYLKVCGFPQRIVTLRWVGVIPLKGRRRRNELPRDFGEAEGLRIDIKYYEIL
jgi:putative transposase